MEGGLVAVAMSSSMRDGGVAVGWTSGLVDESVYHSFIRFSK